MSNISALITGSTFEQVRDRILQILADELSNQRLLALAVNPPTEESIAIAAQIPQKIYAERYSPYNTDEYETISVCMSNTPWNGTQFTQTQHDEAVFNIIITCKSKAVAKTQSEEVVKADQLAAFKLHRLARLCRTILMSPYYQTLGFNPFNGEAVCGRISCTNFRVGHPYSDTQNDSQNYISGAFDLRVLITEEVQPPETIPLNSISTTIGNTNDNTIEIINEFNS